MNISNEALNNIDGIFKTAHDQNRTTLFEHEVYGILSFAGLDIPQYDFVENSRNNFVQHTLYEVIRGMRQNALSHHIK